MYNQKTVPIVIFGNGAMAREVKSIIKRINSNNIMPLYNVIGFITTNNEHNTVCTDTCFPNFVKKFDHLAVAIPMSDSKIKKKIYENIKNIKNISFPNLIDPYVELIDKELVEIGIGNIIEYGTIININTVIGNFNLINLRTIIGHDCQIGNYCTIGPNAILSGNVKLKDNILIGAGAIIKQNLEIGENSVLGLGAFTVKDIAANQIMICEQAQPINKIIK